jgi:hypothetical protein
MNSDAPARLAHPVPDFSARHCGSCSRAPGLFFGCAPVFGLPADLERGDRLVQQRLPWSMSAGANHQPRIDRQAAANP